MELQLECNSLVPSGRIHPHKARFNRRNEVISHLIHVVVVALKNLPIKKEKERGGHGCIPWPDGGLRCIRGIRA